MNNELTKSKNALNCIIENYINELQRNTCDDDEEDMRIYKEKMDNITSLKGIIFKDLEILEILKRILEPTYEGICGTPFMVLKTKKGNVIYEANYDITGNELIKEWLKNDK